jgi:hypothetical protein
MADSEKLLTDEEMQAIEDVVASGDLEGDGYNVGATAESFDLTAKDNRPGFDTTVLEQINERFHRHLRIGLLRELKVQRRSCSRHSRGDDLQRLYRRAPLTGEPQLDQHESAQGRVHLLH